MSELRWILLAAGVALIVALYLFGTRNRQKPSAAEAERLTRIDPPRAPSPPEQGRREPRMSLGDDVGEEDSEPVTAPPLRMPEAAPAAVRREPSLSASPDPVMRADATGIAGAPPRLAKADRLPLTEPPRNEPRPAAAGARPPQKIIAIRVTAAPPDRFDGALLREVIAAARFTHGRYEIFHRLDADGRPVMSLASLLEPGTFDPLRMDTVAYPGVAIFTVMPGPLPGARAFDELLETARWLAQRLGGQLQDDRGAPLSVQRVFKLREEVVAFERSLGSAGGG